MNIFDSIGSQNPKKSAFNLSHSRKFSFSPGKLYPILCQEVIPSDKWNVSTSALVRFQPMIAPMMHLVDVFVYNFFIPARLTMENSKWEVFITGGPKGDGKDAGGTTIQIPYARFAPAAAGGAINTDELKSGKLMDYLGLGFAEDVALGTDYLTINLMPLIAFWRNWCEYFRDQNLHPDYVALYPGIFSYRGDITAAVLSAIANVTNPFPIFDVPNVCWEKDYFTSALPFAQRGSPVETPLSGTGTVTYRTQAIVLKAATAAPGQLRAGTNLNAPLVHAQGVDGGGTSIPAGIENIQDVNLTSGGFTINDLRLAARLQEWLEKMARGGARYVEQIKNIFGVVSSDARLQRCEYLSGGKIPVNISEVLQTGENGTTPLGEMSGHGIAAGSPAHFNKTFEEHGFLMSYIFVRPKTAYQQGIPRLFTDRFDKLNFAWPQFAHLGEQEILNREIYARFSNAEDGATFGYQQRYAEYKYIPSTVHGDFKNSLSFWHWGSIFTTRPNLSPAFVSCNPDPRVFNVLQDDQSMYCIVNHKITAVRPLPYYGEPTL